MSAATIAALRAMMREESANGIQEIEGRISMKMETAMNEPKVELASEGEARQVLQKRVAKLEESHAQQPQ